MIKHQRQKAFVFFESFKHTFTFKSNKHNAEKIWYFLNLNKHFICYHLKEALCGFGEEIQTHNHNVNNINKVQTNARLSVDFPPCVL